MTKTWVLFRLRGEGTSCLIIAFLSCRKAAFGIKNTDFSQKVEDACMCHSSHLALHLIQGPGGQLFQVRAWEVTQVSSSLNGTPCGCDRKESDDVTLRGGRKSEPSLHTSSACRCFLYEYLEDHSSRIVPNHPPSQDIRSRLGDGATDSTQSVSS
ncbi:hypothetical protein E2C01_038431 [Portunus trituberculatus]|uniref:Uncharacterized protein n=1 Tax=Portunus trituberculatus TaxID=210409 RepID=A0A5B7FC73_PORTR|nr:hypothetical protein [Portunus trituberculatus]